MSATFRQNGITIISGRQGVGKSYNIKRMIKSYSSKINKVLIYDVNDEYTEYQPIAWKDIKSQKQYTVRRVLPYRQVNGKIEPFGIEELKNGFLKLLEDYKDGLLILEDFNTYALNTRSQKILSTITRARHKRIDIMIVLQEISKVTKDLWGNMAFYIYHKQTSDIDREKGKIVNFEMCKIADNIVNEQYMKSQLAFDQKKITENQNQINQSFFVYLNFRTNKISGCSKEAFDRGYMRYLLITDKSKTIKEYCMDKGWRFTNEKQRQQAINELLVINSSMYGGK
jgi:hypothetical protein